MTFETTIPDWSNTGVIPAIRPGKPGFTADRSPYIVDLSTVIERFSTSQERIAILDGFLRYRKDLHELGITSGFQWLDGSFLERVELLESRPPRDIDIVSFIDFSGIDQLSVFNQNPALFDSQKAKEKYLVDAYISTLGGEVNAKTIKNISYWYSLWSHRRDGVWKGFVQIDLESSQDADALALLNSFKGINDDS